MKRKNKVSDCDMAVSVLMPILEMEITLQVFKIFDRLSTGREQNKFRPVNLGRSIKFYR